MGGLMETTGRGLERPEKPAVPGTQVYFNERPAPKLEDDSGRCASAGPRCVMDEFREGVLEHHGYIGRVEFNDETGIFYGEVANARDVIAFQGSSRRAIEEAFRASVDDYLEFCAERG